jgi:hypothetical protein
VQDDRLEQALLADVVQELAELGAIDLQQREEVGGRVVVEGGGRRRRAGVSGCLHARYSRERAVATCGSELERAAIAFPRLGERLPTRRRSGRGKSLSR